MRERNRDLDADQFRDWVKKADTETLEDFIFQIEGILYELEAEDYFGTEGFNKRFA